jgi:hypothetical protein
MEGNQMRFYQTTILTPQDLVPPEVYARYGAESIQRVYQPGFLSSIEAFMKMVGGDWYVNNYASGGKLSQCGYRTAQQGSLPLWADVHARGIAIDLHHATISAQELRDRIVEGEFDQQLTYVTRCENSPTSTGEEVTWLHLDGMAMPGTGIYFFKA